MTMIVPLLKINGFCTIFFVCLVFFHREGERHRLLQSKKPHLTATILLQESLAN